MKECINDIIFKIYSDQWMDENDSVIFFDMKQFIATMTNYT